MNKTDLINYLDNNFEDDETDVVLVTRDNFKGFIVVNSNFKIHKETINGKQVAVIEENEGYTEKHIESDYYRAVVSLNQNQGVQFEANSIEKIISVMQNTLTSERFKSDIINSIRIFSMHKVKEMTFDELLEHQNNNTSEEKKFKIVNKDGTETVDWNYIQDYVHEILFTLDYDKYDVERELEEISKLNIGEIRDFYNGSFNPEYTITRIG